MTTPARRRKVLFVEDESALRISYQRFFNDRYDLVFAATGAEALTQLRDEKPEIMVLDMRLPDTNGVEVLRKVRETDPNLPVIITTSYLSVEPQLRMLGLTYTNYLLKPFRLHELDVRLDAIP
ncbi:MAG TPA: response regulator [Gemmatimonadales bacterium]|jgi:DNA-binding response OmpR family regulator|nr:response regulator [Gemmatimonadales bacterium]